MNNLNILGSGGHAKVVIESAKLSGFKINFVYDDNVTKIISSFARFEIKGPICSNICGDSIIAIGDNIVRKSVTVELVNANWVTIIHPSAIISADVFIGEGTVIMAGSTLNADVHVGRHVIVNTNASLDHDCILEDFVHISPNVALSGGVRVGEGTHIGVGACVIPGIRIGKWAIIGAGTVIIKDVPDGATVVGNPGRVIKRI